MKQLSTSNGKMDFCQLALYSVDTMVWQRANSRVVGLVKAFIRDKITSQVEDQVTILVTNSIWNQIQNQVYLMKFKA